MDDPTKDTIPRSAVEYCLRKETVNTNPDAYESHERFIAYMDDPDISQFGHWMHSNGFNCALVSIAVDLDKIPSVTPPPQPGQRNARVFQGIIVEYPSISAYPEYEGKPYFSIKYTENGQGFIGYGTYKPEVLSEYLKEYFMPPTQPGWIPCSERMPFVDEYGKSDQVLATCGLQGAEASSIRWLRILYFNGCNWCFPTGESYEQMVYAWMPLPTPCREGGQDGKN